MSDNGDSGDYGNETSHTEFHNFMQLPEEVQIEIMAHCNFDTRLNLSQTCSEMNRLLFSTPKLIKKVRIGIWLCIELKDHSFVPDDESVHILSTINANQRKY